MNGKKHNSILFITTLSVYLGLVLVGATPQILAQAALTRTFDIKTEIEFEDDLDKNPDEKTLEDYSASVQKLYLLAKEFTEKNPKSFNDGKYEIECAFSLRKNDSSRTTCQNAQFPKDFSASFREITKAFSNDFAEKFLENKDQAKFNLILSENDFVLKTSLNLASKEIADKTFKFFENLSAKTKTEQLKTSQKAVYQNTNFSAENNQVFIVTRLPRASIDEFPIEKSAK